MHRDLKPENLFLVPDPMSPGGERVKVLDFGIAKLRPDWGGSDGPKTRTGVIFGTPAYMSPEQCRGLNDEVDGSTDVYALGCILFEMLCGRAPYISPGWGDVLMMHMSDEIPVPSAENPRVSPAIDQVIKTALAKKKADRFPSMRDMHRALAQARNEVQDTPAPTLRTDPALPAVVIGVDGQLSPGSVRAGAWAARVPGCGRRARRVHAAAATAIALDHRGGAVALGVAGGITLALRRPGASSEPPRVAAPGTGARAGAPAPAEAQGPPAGAAAAAADDEAAEPVDAKVAEAKPAKAKAVEGAPPVRQEKRSGQVVSFRASA